MRFGSKSRLGIIQCILALCFVLLVFLSRVLYAQQPSSNLVLYDNFDETFLSPAKWSPYGACFTWSVLECVRVIQDDRLRLATRSYTSAIPRPLRALRQNSPCAAQVPWVALPTRLSCRTPMHIPFFREIFLTAGAATRLGTGKGCSSSTRRLQTRKAFSA